MDDYQLTLYLHYGSIIHISTFKQKTNYYLFSNGIAFKSIISISANQGPIQPSMALFKITPILKFQSEQFLEKLLNERYQSQEPIQTSEEQAKIFIDQFDFELSENNRLIDQQNRYVIKYNQDFMLQHIYSSKYLSYIKNEKTNEYILELTQIPTKHSVFNLEPCFNYQKDINVYIPFNSAAFLNIKTYEGLEIKDYYLNFRNQSVFDSWVTSEEEKEQISIGLYQTAEEIQWKNICYGDTLWIFHLESGSFVKLREREEQNKSFILKKINYALGYVKQVQPEEQLQFRNEAITSEIFLQKTENQSSSQKFGLWKIIYASQKQSNIINRKQHFDRFKGGKVKFDQEIRFYNIRHQVYLSVRKIRVGRKHKYQLATEKNEESNTAFKLKSLTPNSIYATTQDLFLIQHVLTETYLTLSQPFEVNQTRAVLTPSSDYKKEDNFKFTKIEFIQEWENNNILSIYPFIKEGIRALENLETFINSRVEIILQLLVQNLIELLTFSYDLTEGFEASSNKLGKMTYNHYNIQKLLKEQGIMKELIKILVNIDANILEQNIVAEQRDDFKVMGSLKIVKNLAPEMRSEKKTIPLDHLLIRKVVNLTMKILRNCCKNNNENSLLLFGEMPTFIKFLSLHTYTEQFIMDSFSSPLILDKINKKEFRMIINQYIKVYQKTNTHKPHIFKLLIKLLFFDHQSISKNQLEAFKLIFDERNPLILQIHNRNSLFYISIANNKKQELLEFCQSHYEETETLAWQIKFYAYLTFDRNYVCSKLIKEIFPLDALMDYIRNPSTPKEIKEALILLFTYTYLDERPRFHKKFQKIFNLYQIYTKEDFLKSLNPSSRQNPTHKKIEDQYEYELKEMQNSGLRSENIQQILACVQQKNYIKEQELIEMKEWITGFISQQMSQSDERFYSCDIEASLICLKYMIELSVFTKSEDKDVELLITEVVKRIGQSLQLQNDNKVELKSDNFKELLLEMVEKNVIKRFNYSAKFDGLEDQVGPENICSIYVNYAFYQNILLLQKNTGTGRRKESTKVIESVLQLAKLYNNMFIEEKLRQFISEVVEHEGVFLHCESKEKLINEVLVKKILRHPIKGRQDIIRLLLLLFYNNNHYNINFITISLISNQLFSQTNLIEYLKQLVFIVDKSENDQLHYLTRLYKEIRLLTETSEVWLNANYEEPEYHYNSIILYFVDRLRSVLCLVVEGFRDEQGDVFDCLVGLQHRISLEKQTILSNMDFEEQIFNMIENYKHFLNKIKRVTHPNQLFVKLFRYCFLFLYVFIYNCNENKIKIRKYVQEISVTQYFLKICPIEVGQSRFLIQYLKNNYEECIDFYQKKNTLFSRANKYDEIYSRLQLVLLKYYKEPIVDNLKKLFMEIFDYTNFKNFLWLRDGRQLELDMNIMRDSDHEPMFYHINAIDSILFLYEHLSQSRNTIKNHLKKSLSIEYLFHLLSQDDYYTKENSIKSILKLQIIFKSKLLALISQIYLEQCEPFVERELRKYQKILNVFIDQSEARIETEDYRKIIILKDVKKDEDTKIDFKIKELFEINYGGVHLLGVYLKSLQKFAKSCRGCQLLQRYRGICENIIEQVTAINEILHQDHNREEPMVYPIPNKLNFTLEIPSDSRAYNRKKFYKSIILETIYDRNIYKTIFENQQTSIKILKKILEEINLKQFLFFRKISEFLEDAFEKLPQDVGHEIFDTLVKLINILKLWIECEDENDKKNQMRNLMGKSEIVFPILNYFETCVFDVSNRILFLECLQYLNELLGDQGNRTIQSIFNSYFTNKSDSLDFFMKFKQIIREINFQQRATFKCKKLYEGIISYQSNISDKKLPEFILLNFMINLCKGNYRANQIFLSSLSSVSNFNITRSIWQILRYQKQKYDVHLINVENYYRITQCLSTIRQLVEGPCVENQNEFLKRDFFLTVLKYLQFVKTKPNLQLDPQLQKQLYDIAQISSLISQQLRDSLNQDKIVEEWMTSQVKYRSVSLISSLMSENVNDKSISELLTIPVQMLVDELDRIYQQFKNKELEYRRQNLEFKDEEEVILPLGFKIYELLQYYPKNKLPESSAGLEFFKQNSRIVEIMHQNLTIVVFPRIQTEISSAFKSQFLQKADRASINSKLRDLQNAQIQNRQSDFPYGYIVFVLTLLLILMDLLIYTGDVLPFVKNFAFYSIFFTYNNQTAIQQFRSVILVLIVVSCAIFMFLEIKGAVYMQSTISQIMDSEHSNFQKLKVISKLCFQNFNYFHYFFILLFAILSIFNPLFDSIILVLELFRRSETFYIILKAIQQTMDQLCVVLLINLILTYILASILYYYYNTQFTANCGTLYNCFIFAISVGFKTDPGFVGYNDETHLDNLYNDVSLSDIITNFTYLFIIKVIMDQVIGAIIVDKFAQIREEKQSLEEDQNKFCFICGLERNILDREEDGFEKHKEEYHVVWNYMQFLIHIKQSKLSNLTGIQRFVFDQYKTGKLNWFPINRSFHLQSKKNKEEIASEDAEVEIEKLTKLLDGEINEINQHINQMQDIISIRSLREKKLSQK